MERTHLALLRGINVGGKTLKMEPLRDSLTMAGFKDVQSYIQSGNIILKSALPSYIIADNITTIIAQQFTLDVQVIMKQRIDLEKVLDGNPFSEDDHKQTYFVFTSSDIDQKLAESFDVGAFPGDAIVFGRDVIYIKYGDSAGNSKLTLGILEKKIGIIGTMRNYNTTQKLLQLLSVQ